MIKLLFTDKECGTYLFLADTKAEVGSTDQDIISDADLDFDHLPMGTIIVTTSFEKAMIDSEGNVVWKEE